MRFLFLGPFGQLVQFSFKSLGCHRSLGTVSLASQSGNANVICVRPIIKVPADHRLYSTPTAGRSPRPSTAVIGTETENVFQSDRDLSQSLE